MIRKITTLVAIFTLFGTAFLHAQEATDTGTVTQPNPGISKDALTLGLDPMTKDELEKEAAAWQELLKKKAEAIAQLEIKLLDGDIDKTEANTKLVGLREEKAALVQRTELVLDAYEIKGGDTETARKYVAAVKGIKTGINDVGTRVHAFNAWIKSQDGGIKVLFHVFQFIGVMFLFWLLAASLGKLIGRAIEKQPHLSALLKVFINKMSRRVILITGLVVALGTVGVNVGAALALIGGGAFILAFALQDTLSNFANGIMLLIYRPFDVGDAVEVGGVLGKVDSVSLVSTTILTFDNKKVLVPNGKVWGEVITNITGMTTRRVDMLFGIGYSDDISLAQEIIERVVSEHPLILTDPAPNIGLHELADSSVNFRCWPWSKTSDFLTVRSEVTRRVKEEFDNAGISIPFPQRDVHLYTEEKPVIAIEESNGA